MSYSNLTITWLTGTRVCRVDSHHHRLSLFEMMHPFWSYPRSTVEKHRGFPFISWSFLRLGNDNVHIFGAEVLVELPLFQFHFPLSLAGGLSASQLVIDHWSHFNKIDAEFASPCLEWVLLFHRPHSRLQGVFLYDINEVNVGLVWIPFLVSARSAQTPQPSRRAPLFCYFLWLIFVVHDNSWCWKLLWMLATSAIAAYIQSKKSDSFIFEWFGKHGKA